MQEHFGLAQDEAAGAGPRERQHRNCQEIWPVCVPWIIILSLLFAVDLPAEPGLYLQQKKQLVEKHKNNDFMQDCRPCCGCGPRRFPKATQHRCTGLILNNKPGRRPPWFTTTFYGGAMLLDGFSRLLRTKNFGFMVGTSEMITSRGRSSCGCILDSPAWCAALCVASM